MYLGTVVHDLPYRTLQEEALGQGSIIALYFSSPMASTSSSSDPPLLTLPWPFAATPPGRAEDTPLRVCNFVCLGTQWYIKNVDTSPLFALHRNRTPLHPGATAFYKVASGDVLSVLLKGEQEDEGEIWMARLECRGGTPGIKNESGVVQRAVERAARAGLKIDVDTVLEQIQVRALAKGEEEAEG